MGRIICDPIIMHKYNFCVILMNSENRFLRGDFMEKKKNKFLEMVKWVFIAYLITIVLIAVYSLILAYTDVPEGTIPTVVLLISIVSVLVSSSLAVKKIKQKGLINGAIIGMLYVMFLYILSSIFITGFSLTAYSIAMILLCGLVGIIGVIIGGNM